MWIVCKAGFFNVVCQEGDSESDLLTVKARSRRDLERLGKYIRLDEIEESGTADYRYRAKAKKLLVCYGFTQLMQEIDYPKTKPELSKTAPGRDDIYLQVWGDLYAIQESGENNR